ncbi:hypothetical protein [Rhizobium leguminosarum]|uniref:hypothetical protein n=1 Tax=Rhizobium leguminosarum TaxID=384 RepID=UPI00067E84F3|nr:hypothetical protein [Rhizobium leguminosarum]WFT86820.1 hypothetical protein QA638_04160 [Rhizobium leguminosarum]
MDQHIGDLIVTEMTIIGSHVTGVTHVKPGGNLIASGGLAGGLKIEAGANAVVSGEVGRNVHNDGNLVLSGKVLGRIFGSGTVVKSAGASVSGDDRPLDAV